ncbi:hypothetical protein BH23GEM6_BH23GEM6_17340 [soil metagenome]
MYCSLCGTLVPAGHRSCDSCGNAVGQGGMLPSRDGGGVMRREGTLQHLTRAELCPRCHYQGEGVGYFSRGSRLAALIGVTVMTMGAMGAGGLIYYVLRRDHLICPRCGRGWGPNGERALVRRSENARAMETGGPVAPGNGSWKQGWSIFLFIAAAVLLMVGLFVGEVGVIAAALLSAGGGVVLMQAAGRDREKRREALISALQLPVLKLANQQGGRLTVTEVAAHLGWPLKRAEKILQSLDDGVRVDSDVTDEGVIVYEFRELARGTSSSPDYRLGDGGS